MPKSKKSNKISFTKTRFHRTGIFATMIIFGAIGVIALLRSYAANGRIKVNAPVVAIAAAGANNKYWVTTSDGGVFALPTGTGQTAAPYYGSMGGKHLNQPITSMAPRPQHDGYWLLGGDGGVFAFGGAAAYNTHPTLTSTSKFYRTIVPTGTGKGYWIIGALGEIVPEGDATSTNNLASSGYRSILTDYKKYNTNPLSALPGLPTGGIVSAARTTTGRGMYLLSDTGHVYAYGDAVYRGWASAMVSGDQAVSIESYGAGSSGGYLIVTAKGYVIKYSSAPSYGDVHTVKLAGPIVGLAYTPGNKGYWLAGQDGGIFALGDAVFQQALSAPVPTPTPTPPASKPPKTTPPATTTTTKTTTTTTTSTGSNIVPTSSACAGDLKNDIKQLQTCLNSLAGKKILAVDGVVGPATRQACSTYLKGFCPYPVSTTKVLGGTGDATQDCNNAVAAYNSLLGAFNLESAANTALYQAALGRKVPTSPYFETINKQIDAFINQLSWMRADGVVINGSLTAYKCASNLDIPEFLDSASDAQYSRDFIQKQESAWDKSINECRVGRPC